MWAPSAHNAQPWRFIMIDDQDVKRRLAEAMAEEWDEDLERDGVPADERNRLIEESIKQFTHPPILILICLTMENMKVYPDRRRRKAEYTMAVQSVAAAIQNMLLEAYCEGLGACWFSAPLFCQDRVREVLGIPCEVEPQALITLGYPDEKPEAPMRKPLGRMLHRNLWRG